MHIWLPTARFADRDASILRGCSPHRLVEARFGAVPSSGRRQNRAVPADPRIAAEVRAELDRLRDG